jgi:alcohol/geraniol dehydrogenase (NADP+)
MSTLMQTSGEPVNGVRRDDSMRDGSMPPVNAWTARAAKAPLVLETLDLGPLDAEEVEVAVEHCGLCHSDLSVVNDDWGISRFPAVLGHEVVGRIIAVGRSAKGLIIGQRVGVGWFSGSCLHCRQ